MFIVVSKWRINPGKFDAAKVKGEKMTAIISSWPEVEFFHNLRTEDGNVLAIIGYRSEAEYRRLIADGGAFDQAAQQVGLAEGDEMEWLWSERGEPLQTPASV